MAKVPVLITLLLQLFCMLVKVSGQSPCPEYFTYVSDSSTNEVMGQIQIPSPQKNVDLHLRIGLSVAVALPTRYVGRLELAQSKEESVRLVQLGRPLHYIVHFPLQQPIPILTGIWFNNQQYCIGPRAVGSIITSIMLEHTLYPPQVVPLSQNSVVEIPVTGPVFSLPSFQPNRPNRPNNPPINPTKKPVNLRPPETTTQKFSHGTNVFLYPNQDINDCGRSNHVNNINLLISKGVKTSPGQWPWLVALFLVKIEFEFQCAGSILTNRHVITAAHCFKLDAETNANIPSSAMLVSLGRYRLREWREVGSVNREVENYILHPDYTHQGTGDSDLAILILRTPVEFSPTIRPICLWSASPNLLSVTNQSGYVVGWGRDEFGNAYLSEPRMAKAKIVSQEECLWSDPRFVGFTSNRTFCAGSRDGSGPCNGDSGSGLMLYDANIGRYQLRGIVSRSLLDRNEMTCDLTQYVVYVDVAKYIQWIRQQIST